MVIDQVDNSFTIKIFCVAKKKNVLLHLTNMICPRYKPLRTRTTRVTYTNRLNGKSECNRSMVNARIVYT